MLKIWTFVPFSHEKNFGKAYNEYCRLVPNDEDWIMVKDGDVMFLTPDYEIQIRQVIEQNPNTAIFTCLTNRVGNPEQCYQGQMSENSDIKHHREIAMKLQALRTLEVKETKRDISGMVMIFQKKYWRANKFKEKEGKILAIDTDFSQRALIQGHSIKVMQGVYVFHYYRLIEGRKYKAHLK